MDPLLSCHNITKSFHRTLIPVRNFQEWLMQGLRPRQSWSTIAVNNVSLSVAPGEWVGVYGPNGCGKTTLLRILAGLIAPDTGTVERQETLSCFFDLSTGFHEERTAEENVRMHALLQGCDMRTISTILERTRAFAAIDDHWDLPMKCYSAGMRLRLGFAVTTAAPGEILLLDEILAVGDASFQKQCFARILVLKQSGRSALMVSHSLSDLEGICDRVIFLEGGRITHTKDTRSICTSRYTVPSLVSSSQ